MSCRLLRVMVRTRGCVRVRVRVYGVSRRRSRLPASCANPGSPWGQASPFGTAVTVQGRPTGGDLALFMSEEINGMLVWKWM